MLADLGTDTDARLSDAEADRRLGESGSSKLTRVRGRRPLFTLLLDFHRPLVYILLTAAAVTGFLGEWVDSRVILGVVLVNAAVGIV